MSDSTATELGSGPAVQTAAPAPARQRGAVRNLVKSDDSLSGRQVQIKIHGTKDETQKGPVFVGLNGNGYQIPRDVECIVPIEVAEILDNATETLYDASSGKEVLESTVPRHAYNAREVRATA